MNVGPGTRPSDLAIDVRQVQVGDAYTAYFDIQPTGASDDTPADPTEGDYLHVLRFAHADIGTRSLDLAVPDGSGVVVVKNDFTSHTQLTPADNGAAGTVVTGTEVSQGAGINLSGPTSVLSADALAPWSGTQPLNGSMRALCVRRAKAESAPNPT
ncbi:MAG TPA: hypothetical protein VGO53_15420 [Steroidobacteraceae bacterium]|nr:hypothetical protein [Steroidobacteraceae bacterium]